MILAALAPGMDLLAQVPTFTTAQLPTHKMHPKQANTKATDGSEWTPQDNQLPVPQDVQSSILSASDVGSTSIIGITLYDLQSNASIDDRMAGSGDAVSAAWTQSLETGAFDDRGTGYNFYDGELWGEQPLERLEDVRVGWPSILHMGNGTEVVITHEASGDFTAPLVMMTSPEKSDSVFVRI